MTVKGDFQTHLKALSTGIILDREYRGKTLGFDCSMLTHKFMLRDPVRYKEHGDTSKIVSAHVKYAFDLIEVGVDPVFVLDGWACPGKAQEDANRTANRDTAMAAYLLATGQARVKLLRKALNQTWELKRDIIDAFRAKMVSATSSRLTKQTASLPGCASPG
jgi:hypothetical protein